MNSIEKSEDGWLIPKSPITFDYLKRFNRNMGILHLVQGLLMVLFGLIVANNYIIFPYGTFCL